MSKTLYVGNLPWQTTENDLADVFRQHGTVISSRIVTDRDTGRARGFGFVEVDDADAEKMVAAMNDTEVGGRRVVVNEARQR
ncbi:RNA recognition motif domain-containing protein [Propionispora hippei]|uniref:RNA recognition motif. (A.k.a. RRM, RBD, or RNP domain) n=1 Tax=Propionispora hippei DSM 15287 TaxID=1123003 RepID=A0A1M6FSM7_9FIRM|nr:RNA-binding protein [Propionispora hippei]SHJ00633.1 RNA recognition motif. (a.k.a. RRM, RBD, or RNP domain) [Propionispora hippei DSM 15287]